MHKPALTISVGIPSAHGDGPDEDNLDRERDGDDGDLATEAVETIVRNLQEGKAAAVRELRAFTGALEALCDAFMERDYHAVGEAASDARDVLNVMLKK